MTRMYTIHNYANALREKFSSFEELNVGITDDGILVEFKIKEDLYGSWRIYEKDLWHDMEPHLYAETCKKRTLERVAKNQ